MNWASQRHPQQEQGWLLNRYWQHMEQQKWVFATPEGVQLRAYNQQPIVPLPEKKVEKTDK